MPSRCLLTLLVAVIATVVPAGAAHASSAAVNGDTLVVAGSSRDDELDAFNRAGKRYPSDFAYRVFGYSRGDRQKAPPSAGAGCERVTETAAQKRTRLLRCPSKASGIDPASIRRIRIEGGSGDDALAGIGPGSFSEGEKCHGCAPVKVPLTLSGGPGTDFLFGVNAHDVLDAGDGDDTVYGFDFDSADGGPGNDVVGSLTVGPQVVDLAAGTVGRPNGPTTRAVNFESVSAGEGADTLLGTDGPNEIESGDGHNTIDPRGGMDEVRGGDDGDSIRSLDGAVDEITCGSGRDHVIADFADRLHGCELVERITPASAAAGDEKVDCPDATVSARRRAHGRIAVRIGFAATPAFICTAAIKFESDTKTGISKGVTVVPGTTINFTQRLTHRQQRSLFRIPECAQANLSMADSAGNVKSAIGRIKPLFFCLFGPGPIKP